MPKVLLIAPPLTAERQAGSLKDIANVIPPLGVAYVAAATEQAGFEAAIIDGPQARVGIDDLVARAVEQRPEVIGVGATILTIYAAQELSRALREALPRVRLILGGPMVTSMPQVSLENSAFDCAVLGEGEEVFPALCRMALEGPWDPLSLPGVALLAEDGTLRQSERPPLIADLDALPMPAWHLLPPPSAYRPMPAGYRRRPMAHVVASRGCPFHCVYCDRSVYGNKFRTRSPGKVVDEVQMLMDRYGAREVKFYDDLFNVSEKRVLAICEEIRRRGLDVSWSCSCRVGNMTAPMAEAMKAAGCWQVDFGLESGNQAILDRMHKGQSLAEMRRGVGYAKRAGLRVRAFFIVGMPGETRRSMEDSLALAKELELDVITFYALMVYPGNELFAELNGAGKLRHLDFSHFTSVIDLKTTPLHYVPDDLSEEEIKGFIKSAYRRFYLRPSYVLRRLASIRSWDDLVFDVKSGLMLLGM